MEPLQQATTVPREARPILLACKRAVREILPDATVLLYGSLARGTAGPESDWDILVLAEQPLSPVEEQQVRAAVYDLEVEHDVVLSLLLYPRQEWEDPRHRAMPFHQQVQSEAIVL